jgi:hypothetical protein
MKTKTTSPFTLALRTATDSVRRAQALATLAPHLAAHPQVRRAYTALTRALPKGSGLTPWLDISSNAQAVTIGLSLENLESFKDALLLDALEPFAGAGTDGAGTPVWRAESRDYVYNAPNRDYWFTQSLALEEGDGTFVAAISLPRVLQRAYARAYAALKDMRETWALPKTFELRVGIYAYVKSDSPLCRVVVKGIEEKIVREEIKEIVCA